MLLTVENKMYEFGGSEIFVLFIVALVFGLGIYTLLKFRKNKNF
jgi:heme/copper-type cytochrome/quinol oxidase subunit 2